MKEGIFINQSKYTKEILNQFGLEDSKPYGTSLSSTYKLDKDEKEKKVDQKLYRGMIRSLLYLTASRPDIIYCICIYARF